MARGRGRGGGGRRGGGGGGGRGGRGRGRGGSGGGDRKDARHIRMFGEQHPSQEMKEFGGEPSAKKSKFPDNGRGFRGRGRGRGGSRGSYQNNFRHRVSNNVSSSEESDSEAQTPYNELLSLFKSKKGIKNEIKILSDEEEEDEEEEESNDDEDLNDQDESASDEEKPISDVVQDNQDEDESESEIPTGTSNDVPDVEQAIQESTEETVIEEAEINPDMEDENLLESADPFLLHFEREMPEVLVSHLKEEKARKVQSTCVWPQLDKLNYSGLEWKEINEHIQKDRDLHSSKIDLSSTENTKPIMLPQPPNPLPSKNTSLESYSIKSQLCSSFPIVNQKVMDSDGCRGLNSTQAEILEIASQYFDGYFPIRTIENEEAIRNAYCLHAANHILKTRTRILHHNAKLTNRIDVPEAYRDQGFVRPKILILVPFKDTAYKIIQTLISILLPEEKGNVANKKRFMDEYGGSTLFLPKTNPKPDDYNATFSGNCEDNFKIGLSLTKKTVKLFTGFYSSDVIVTSPLGLRMIIGAEGEKNRDYDFLSSIEMLILDQADIFLMQNWDHVLHIMKHLHLQPITTHGTDFARIRPFALDGLSSFFRQTLIFSEILCPEHSSLMTKYCKNYAGQVRLAKQFAIGSINNVTVQLPHIFQYFEASSLQNADDERFDFFVKTVLPNFTEKLMSHTVIFVSSYFDFVRLRNHFKREQSSFVQICEYTKDKKVARARDYFFHGQGHFILYTERVHFFRRFRLKGVGHILFYQLPQYPRFYPELINFIREDYQNRRVRQRKNASVNVIYSKYDTPRLSAIVGSERASQMLTSDKNVHAFVSGEL